jgi:hypothetical protein
MVSAAAAGSSKRDVHMWGTPDFWFRHCEERSDEAIHLTVAMDCRVASLHAMTRIG